MEEKKEDALHPEAQFDAAFDAEPVQEPEASKEEGQLPSEETPERDRNRNAASNWKRKSSVFALRRSPPPPNRNRPPRPPKTRRRWMKTCRPW